MSGLNRRRFLTIAAGAATAGASVMLGRPSAALPLYQWRGVAMGTGASITLAHPNAAKIVARAVAEISRLEGIFSLYRGDSSLSLLNATGALASPPFELLECLTLCGAVHDATGGLFDPTIQPFWRLYADSYANGTAPGAADLAAAQAKVGWGGVAYDAQSIRFARPGMALTLNGVAQGYIADCVAALLAGEGLGDILVDTGEFFASGGHPDGGDWPVALEVEGVVLDRPVALRDRGLASSAPRGTVFDAAGVVGHILNPLTGRPSQAAWQLVSVTAPSAGLADALSSALCLMTTRSEIDAALAQFPAARLVYLG